LINEIKAYVGKHPNANVTNDANMVKFQARANELKKIAPHDILGDALQSAAKDTIGAISKIPVLGPVLKAATAPLSMVVSLSHGERIDHALLDAAKSQLGGIKAIAPYAAAVVSFIPGIGTGVAAALAAGAALAEGKPIDQALEDAVKAAIPGGALAVSGFELAKKVASGQNVGKAVLEAARDQLPKEAQQAFDVGLAVVSGKQLQSAITSAIVNLAPGEVKQILDVGAKAVQSVPGLATLAKSLPTDTARQGLQLASGALAHAGVNEAQLRAMRSKLTGDVLKGFDTALHSQATHFPWINNVVAQTPTPIVQEAPTQDQLDLLEISKLTPEQQKQLVEYKKAQDDLQALSRLTSAQQKQLVDYANAKNAPAPTPKPHEPPAKPAAAKPVAAPKPHELPAKKSPAAPATAAAAVAPATGGLVYGPYPSGAPSGAVHGVLAGYGAYPSVLSAPPPHPHPPHGPHGGHGGGARPIQDGRTWGWRGPWWGVPFIPDASTSTLEVCRVWGSPVALPPAMERAARAALGASRGNPTAVRGPDGALYLFAFENGQLSARPCAAIE
jgi:hypothetical protein